MGRALHCVCVFIYEFFSNSFRIMLHLLQSFTKNLLEALEVTCVLFKSFQVLSKDMTNKINPYLENWKSFVYLD